MGALGATASALAILAAYGLVLGDLTAYDRPLPAPPKRRPEPPRAAPRATEQAEPASMLAALTVTETDERSVLRSVGALVVLLTLTLLTAGLVGAGIYRAVSGLG